MFMCLMPPLLFSAGSSKNANEPPTLWLRCSEHGIEKAFAADMMCVKCEEEHHGYLQGSDYVEVKTVSELLNAQDTEQGKRGGVRRRSSFAFH